MTLDTANHSWVKFRDAVIGNDHEYVKEQLPYKDFRLFLTSQSNALDLAARYGHMAVVNEILRFMCEFPRKEKVRVLTAAICHACKGGNTKVLVVLLELVTYYENYNKMDLSQPYQLEPSILPPEDLIKSYQAAIASKNQDCIKCFTDYLNHHLREETADGKNEILWQAFHSGDPRVLAMVLEDLDMEVSGMTYPVSEAFIYCALGDAVKVREEMEKNDDWFEFIDAHCQLSHDSDDVLKAELEPGTRGCDLFAEVSIFGIVAMFGHFELLKEILERLKELEEHKYATSHVNRRKRPQAWSWSVNMHVLEILLHAWTSDQIEIVQWLHHSGQFELKLTEPYQYPGIYMLHCGRNRVFEYIMGVTCPDVDNLTITELGAKVSGISASPSTDASISVIDYYVNTLNAVTPEDVMDLCETAVHADCSLLLSKLEGKLALECPDSHNLICRLFRDDWDYTARQKELVCLPNLEIILEKLSGVECSCGHSPLIELLPAEADFTRHPEVPYSVHLASVSAAMKMLLSRSAYPTSDFIDCTFDLAFLTLDKDTPHALARIACLLDLMDITRVIKTQESLFKPDLCSDFFQKHGYVVDVLLQNILKGLAGCQNHTIPFPGLLDWILRSPRRIRVWYMNFIPSLGLVIQDPELDTHMSNLPDYDSVQSLARYSVPSLTELVKLDIYKLLRREQEQLSQCGQVFGFQELVIKFSCSPDIRGLPDPLPNLFFLPKTKSL